MDPKRPRHQDLLGTEAYMYPVTALSVSNILFKRKATNHKPWSYWSGAKGADKWAFFHALLLSPSPSSKYFTKGCIWQSCQIKALQNNHTCCVWSLNFELVLTVWACHFNTCPLHVAQPRLQTKSLEKRVWRGTQMWGLLSGGPVGLLLWS